jgi:SNF2 family DNA or RNA helicase
MALNMPRVSLLLADDVGLGKSIEGGLILSELIRRRRIRRVLILCPAWLSHQWKEEMKSKFNLGFETVDRAEEGQRRSCRLLDQVRQRGSDPAPTSVARAERRHPAGVRGRRWRGPSRTHRSSPRRRPWSAGGRPCERMAAEEI